MMDSQLPILPVVLPLATGAVLLRVLGSGPTVHPALAMTESSSRGRREFKVVPGDAA